MKKYLLASLILSASFGVQAQSQLTCNDNSSNQKQVVQEDAKKQKVFIEMDLYNEHETKLGEKRTAQMSQFNFVSFNGEETPFHYMNKTSYLVKKEYTSTKLLSAGNNKVGNVDIVNQIKDSTVNTGIIGHIYTLENKDNSDKVNVNLCLSQAYEMVTGSGEFPNVNNEDFMKNMDIKYNTPTIVSLKDGVKMRINIHKI